MKYPGFKIEYHINFMQILFFGTSYWEMLL